MEKEWQKVLNGGGTIKIEVQYKGGSQRPTQFKVKYEMNNRKLERHIKNI